MARRKHFGLGREELIQRSGVRKIFTPHRPVQSVELFFGRQKEVQKLIEHINTPGQHGLLFGDRGVGKSSLANIAAYLLQSLMNGELYIKRCDRSDTFCSIVAKPLLDKGFDIQIKEKSEKQKQGGSAKIKTPIAEAGIGADQEITSSFVGVRANADSPSWVAEQLQDMCALLVIDEADSIAESDERIKLAELMKLLSDADSAFKILLVGIAEAGRELVGGHRSIERCLKETHLGSMTNSELREIVLGGAKRLKIGFDPRVLRGIVNLSSGYPHFTHLLALKSAEETLAHERSVVIEYDLGKALESAAEDAESSLRYAYNDAIRSSRTDIYRYIVGAAAACGHHDFSASQIGEKLNSIFNTPVSRQGLNNYLRKLSNEDNDSIIRRVGPGVYCFSDPRMASYVKVVEKWAFMVAGEA